jgi:hypothetical protein
MQLQQWKAGLQMCDKPLWSRRRLLAGVAGCLLTTWLPRPGGAAAVPQLDIDNLYTPGDITRLNFAPNVLAFAGEIVSIEGYQVPHSRNGARFFCVSSEPGKTCPHCADMLTVPRDMVAYYGPAHAQPIITPNERVRVAGILELGAKRDFETGFVTTIRLRAPSVLVS